MGASRATFGILSTFAMLFLFVSVGHSQCVGDCDGNGVVTPAELVTAVRAALGEPATCSAADREGDGVTIDEVVAAVSNSTSGCPAAGTATPTATPTPTRTPQSATATTTPVAGCGDGIVDFANGETCDDSNTVDDDGCPANCRIRTCALSSEPVEVDIDFTVPGGIEVVGVQTFLRYADGVVGIPGRGGDDRIFDRLTEIPENVVLQPNDLDYGLIMIAYSFDSTPIVPGRLFTATFDRCRDARLPAADDFRCVVKAAGDASGTDVSGVACTATLR